ncbi:hypothetical protein [Fibrisoma limi]|uniref:hypothetical protein n=1 Tax=Fibrisoma limi TaxID=663275 RepID=UPI000586F302|nr:hypothetical protein [Fibrisoma limi]
MKNILVILMVTVMQACHPNDGADCLPYVGRVYGTGCSAVAVKVLNREVNSRIPTGQNSFENNVIELLGIPDTVRAGQPFYFDFRDVQPQDEAPPCQAIFAAASRKVVLTRFGYTRCDIP